MRSDADVADDAHGDRVKATDRHRIVVDLDDRLVGRDAGVVREGSAEDDDEVALIHEPACDRGAGTAEDAAAEGVVVADLALGFEGRRNRGVDLFGQRDDRFHVVARSGADDDEWSLSFAKECDRLVE